MSKTSTGLVDFCEQAYNAGTGYVYGTIGQMCTTNILNQCAARYPANNYAGGPMRTMGNKWLGHRVVDCIGLLKYYVMSDSYGENPHYLAEFDTSANGAFNNADEKGSIDTIPEIPGLCVHMPGHFGIYIGNGWVIEARGTYYGVVKTRLQDRPWTYWFKSPWIEYESAAVCDTTCDIDLTVGQTYQFKVTAESPEVTIGTDGVVALLPRYTDGNDHYYYIVAWGQSDTAAGIYVNGVKQFVAKIK